MPTKRSDGRLQTSIRITNSLTGERKKVYVYGYSLEELNREIARIKRNNSTEIIAPTFGEWTKEWLKIKTDEVSKVTINTYKDTLRLHILPSLGKYKLKNITPSLIRSVLRSIQATRVREYSYMLINAILKQAYIEDLILKNPCISIKKPKHKTQETTIISNKEFQSLMTVTKDTQYEALFRLAYDTGMRRSEIAALRWKNINIKDKIISVKHAIKTDRHANNLTDKFFIGEPKTEDGIRQVSLTYASASILQKHFEKQKTFFKKHDRILSQNDFVFTSNFRGNFADFMQPDSISHAFVRFKRKAGITSTITFKSFRHTCLTILAEGNISPKAIQAHAGHSDAAFTLNRYVHKTIKMEHDIGEFLNKRNKNI